MSEIGMPAAPAPLAPPASAALTRRRHLGGAVARCPRCAAPLCVDCPRCSACGSLSCAACLAAGRDRCPRCAVPRGTATGGETHLAPGPESGATGWLLAWLRPVPASSGRDAESVFGVVDRMTSVVLGVLLGVAALVAVSAAVLAVVPGPERSPAHDGVGDGTRVATLLRNPRRPPAFAPGPDNAGASATSAQAAQGTAEDLRPLVVGRADGAAPTWWVTRQRAPVDLQFAAGESGRGGVPIPIHAGRVLFAHAEGVRPDSRAKDVEGWASLTPEQEELVPLGRWTLEQRAGPQVFAFPRRAVWGLTLRIHSNHGHPTDTTLAEFALLPSAS